MTIKWPLRIADHDHGGIDGPVIVDADGQLVAFSDFGELLACANAGARLPKCKDNGAPTPPTTGEYGFWCLFRYSDDEDDKARGWRVSACEYNGHKYDPNGGPAWNVGEATDECEVDGPYSTHEAAEAAMREPTQ